MTSLSPTALEEAAKAIAASYGEDPDDYASLLDICGPNNEPLLTWQKYAEQSTASITAYLAQAEKEGWVMVPINPTEAMLRAGDEVMCGRYGCSFEVTPIYHTMILAAQNGVNDANP